MGGFFSKQEEVIEGIPVSSNTNSLTNVSYPKNLNQPQISYQSYYTSTSVQRSGRLQNLSNFDENSFPSTVIVRDHFVQPIFELIMLNPQDMIYREIQGRITNRFILVDSIEVIHAPFLLRSYKMKLSRNPEYKEFELFHGTKWKNVDSICINNFNWRYHGEHIGNRFGQGVSFSCNAMYAANYSKDQTDKVMFIAKVMIGKSCKGNKKMILPNEGCDTSKKQDDNIVIVKYEDNEFCPIYRIKFHFAPNYMPRNQRR